MGANSKERHSLLPVLATLLAFSETELARVREGLKWEAWGGLLQVKEIKRYVTHLYSIITHTYTAVYAVTLCRLEWLLPTHAQS